MEAHEARIAAMFVATDDVIKQLKKAPDVSNISIRDLQNSWALVIDTSKYGIHDCNLKIAFSDLCTFLQDPLDWVDFCIKMELTTMGHRRILKLYKWMKYIHDLNEDFSICFTPLSSEKEYANNYILENQPADQPPAEDQPAADQPDAATEAEENNNFSSSSKGSEKEGGGNTSVSHGSSSSSSDSGSSSSESDTGSSLS